MTKKIVSFLMVMLLTVTMTGCGGSDDSSSGSTTTTNSSIKIKTVKDFKECEGMVKYFTIEGKKFSIPETVGEFANYLEQLGDVTLNMTGKSVNDEKIAAKKSSSMVSYLLLKTDDGKEQRFGCTYTNKTKDTITVAEASVTKIHLYHDAYSEQEYEKSFDSIEINVYGKNLAMTNKVKMEKVGEFCGTPVQNTDGRLHYNDPTGYKYIFDCCNENRTGIFRGLIIEYPSK